MCYKTVLAILILLCSCLLIFDQVGLNYAWATHIGHYQNAALRISFKYLRYPIPWNVSNSTSSITLNPPDEIKKQLPNTGLDIKLENISSAANLTSIEYASGSVNFVRSSLPAQQQQTFKVKSNNSTTVSGIPAVEVEYQYIPSSGAKPVDVLQYYIKANDLGYVITYRAEPAMYEQYVPYISFMIKSMKIG